MVIVQVQSGDVKYSGINFRNLLVRRTVEAAKDSGIERLFYMSASMNYYNVPSVRNQMLDMGYPIPNPKTVIYNYDRTAKRIHFKFDECTGLFVRNF